MNAGLAKSWRKILWETCIVIVANLTLLGEMGIVLRFPTKSSEGSSKPGARKLHYGVSVGEVE